MCVKGQQYGRGARCWGWSTGACAFTIRTTSLPPLFVIETYEMFLLEMFHLLFSSPSWPWVTGYKKSKTWHKVGGTIIPSSQRPKTTEEFILLRCGSWKSRAKVSAGWGPFQGRLPMHLLVSESWNSWCYSACYANRVSVFAWHPPCTLYLSWFLDKDSSHCPDIIKLHLTSAKTLVWNMVWIKFRVWVDMTLGCDTNPTYEVQIFYNLTVSKDSGMPPIG